jgi:transposase
VATTTPKTREGQVEMIRVLRVARRWQQLQAELDRLDRQLQELVSAVAPTLVALPGVGIDTAGQLLVTAGDNPQTAALGRPPSPTCAAYPRSRRPRAAPTATD